MDDTNTAPVDASTNDTSEGVDAQDAVTNPTDTDAGKLKEIAENQRIRAEKAEAKLKELAQSATQTPTQFDPSLIDKTVTQKLEERDLSEMTFPDEIKEQIKRVAAISGVSVRQAAQDPWIQSQIAEHARAEKVRQASPDTSGGATQTRTFDPENPPDVDLTTPEGQEAQLAWERELERRNNGKFKR